MLNAEKIANSLNEASQKIGDYTVDLVSEAVRALEKIENVDKKYKKSLNSLKSIYYDIQELSRDLELEKEEVYFDEEERNKTETRLDIIYTLKRKYGNSVEEILKYGKDVKERIEKIENAEEYVNKLKEELKEVTKYLEEIAIKMHKMREKGAKFLEEKINKELKELEMKNAKFHVKLEYDEKNRFTQNGLDKIEFMISTNIGEDEKPLVKIASRWRNVENNASNKKRTSRRRQCRCNGI